MPLPDVEQMPDELVMPTESLRQNAKWASTFAGSGTNLAQRHRHNADIKAYTERLQDEQQAAMQHRLETSKGAQDVYFRGRKLEMDETAAITSLREREMRMRNAEELHPLTMKAREATTAAAIARERNTVLGTKLKADLQKQEEDDTTAFQSELQAAMASGVKLRTPAYTDTVATLRAKYGAVNTQFFDDIWKTTGSTLTPEEIVERTKALQAALPGAAVSVNQKGAMSATVRPSPKVEELLKKELHIYEGKRQTASDKDERDYADANVIRLRSQLGIDASAPDAEAPATAATTEAKRQIFRDAQGLRAYKNPDGTFEPIQ